MSETPVGLVDRVLAYVDAPWKIASIAALAIIAIVSVTCWEQRAQIATRILESSVVPRLEPQNFAHVAAKLIDETHADLVMLSRVSILNNLVTNIDGRYVAQPQWRPRPDARSVFGGPATLQQVAATVEGQVICEDVPAHDGRRVDVSLGMARRCWVGVPPIPDVLVGVLGVAWKTAPDPHLEDGARSELRRLAMKLATW